MWLLSCDGDLFAGKRIWLRPGTTHLLGRTTGRMENGERVQYLNSKSVSRKHLTIAVSSVPAGDSAKLFARSEIKFIDGSKAGTLLNGQKVQQETSTLQAKEYEIKLGSYEHLFHLVWHPVTLSFASGSKKAKEEALGGERRDVLEQADVKVVTDYVSNETTHAISKKRNTTAALQALLQARWVVTNAFVDALYTALRLDNADGLAALEQDFDAHWPSEEKYVPPVGTEPQPRPDSFFKPNPDRAEVFQNYSVVFLAQSQYDNLLPVITSGGGKALLKDIESSTVSAEEVVNYIRQVAGRKHDKSFRLSQRAGSGGVLVVRPPERDEAMRNLISSIDLALDQRSIEQSEFLDAILAVDASGLKRQLEVIDSESVNADEALRGNQSRSNNVVEVSPPPSKEASPAQPTSQVGPAKEEEMPDQPLVASRRRNRRIITESRFKGFDDFDPSQFSKAASGSPEPSDHGISASQGGNAHNMDVDEPSQAPVTQQNTRKRTRAERNAKEDEEMYAAILPGHTALKKRKMEAAKRGEVDPFASAVTESVEVKTEPATKGKKKSKELDVRAEVAKRREAEEERRRLDEESLREAMEGVDIKELKNLAKVETMEIPEREHIARNHNSSTAGDRWDPAWNGRKNFKKFRRRDQHNEVPQLRRVMVALEEVPRKGHGLGDEYWLTPSSSIAATNRSKSKSQSQSQNARFTHAGNGTRSQRADGTEDNDDVEASRFRRRLQRSREEDAEQAIVEEMQPEEVAGRSGQRTIRDALGSTDSQTLPANSPRGSAAGKRPAAQQGGPPSKRTKQTMLAPPRSMRDEEDEDGLKFRRRR